jgi:hypothetical protein
VNRCRALKVCPSKAVNRCRRSKEAQGGMTSDQIVSCFRLFGSNQELKEFVVCKAL